MTRKIECVCNWIVAVWCIFQCIDQGQGSVTTKPPITTAGPPTPFLPPTKPPPADIDECSAGGHDCDRNANCSNTVGSFRCACKSGYSGNGKSCLAKTTVFCHSDRFGVSMLKNMSSFATVTLRDASCTASSNATHITLSTSFSQCNSTKNETKDHIVVSNAVIMLGAASGIISRGKITVIPFTCKYARSGLQTSLVSFQPTIKTLIEAQESGFGNFTLNIKMARTVSFDSYYNSYPVVVEINDRLYIKISLKANNTDAVLLIEKCYATPTLNKNDATKYIMIQDRCPTDNTLQFHSGEIFHKKFSFLAFKFVTNASAIYLHCQVFLCHKSSKASRCTSGCGVNKVIAQRKKRGIEKRDITLNDPDFTKPYTLVTGEIRGKVTSKKENHKKEHKKGASSASTTTIAMGASIGILALGLISIIIMKMIKHMQLTAASNGKLGIDNKAMQMDNCD